MVSWVTVIWSMIASACLTLAAIYLLAWFRNRSAWAHLFFALTAASTAGLAFGELWLMRADTSGQFLAALRWASVPLFFWVVSTTWFVRFYLGTGRLWLAWTICGFCGIVFLLNVTLGQDDVGRLTSVRPISFLGESIAVPGGLPNTVTQIAQVASLLILIFVAEATSTAWRRVDRRKALTVGGGVAFFIVASLGTASAAIWGKLQIPIVFSPFYMALVAVLGYELSRDVLRASQLVTALQTTEAGLRASEARMSLAVESGDFGIWIWDLSQNDIWASDSWRAMHGFAPLDSLQFDQVLQRVHADDREALRQTHSTAIDSAEGGRYEVEYRLTGPDGAPRWISSQGRVERDGAGHPVLIRGTSREVTAHKRAELAMRSLSGRLLSAQEEERRRIARELHDNLSQQVALLANEIDQVALGSGVSRAAAPSMQGLRERTAGISTEIHNLSHRLHSTKLEMLGLVAAVRGHCQELRAQGLHTHFHDEHVPRTLPADVELCLFRIVQEALNNVAKHSGAREADVTLRGTGNVLFLTVSDSGRGFDEAAAAGKAGLGLASMRERLRLIEGELTIRSQPGQGTTILARVPISRMTGKSAAETAGVA